MSTPRTLALYTARLAHTVLAMAGWRLDRLTLAGALAGALSLAAGHAIIAANAPALTLPYFALTLAFYYGGITWYLGSQRPRLLVARLGEAAALQRYRAVVALMFIHQGLGVGCMTALQGAAVPVVPCTEGVAHALGAALFAVGFVVKVWATMLVGVETYYFEDLFLGRPLVALVTRGPYRWLRNPMYGVGQLHGYGYALWHRSFAGFAAMALCHALLYAFYFAVELPFVQRLQAGGGAEAHAPTAGEGSRLHDARPERCARGGLFAFEALPRSHPLRVLATAAAMVGLRLDRSPRQTLCALAAITASAVLGLACTGTDATNLLGVTGTGRPSAPPSPTSPSPGWPTMVATPSCTGSSCTAPCAATSATRPRTMCTRPRSASHTSTSCGVRSPSSPPPPARST